MKEILEAQKSFLDCLNFQIHHDHEMQCLVLKEIEHNQQMHSNKFDTHFELDLIPWIEWFRCVAFDSIRLNFFSKLDYEH